MMNTLKEIDVWIGKKVFHPPVILLCRIMECTQHRLHRDLWFVAVMFLVCMDAFVIGESVVWWKWIILTIVFIRAALVNQNVKSDSSFIFRMFVYLMIFIDMILVYYNSRLSELVVSTIFHIVILLAEYAATIDTLPPRKKKEKKQKEVYHESLVG